jgi:predicted Zn-dependent peptidase
MTKIHISDSFDLKSRLAANYIISMKSITLKFFIAALIVILTPSVSFAVPAEYEKLVDGITKISLDNGMKILVAKRSYAPVFNGQLWVKVGSSDELTGKSGAAHLLEHMAFKGTKKIGTSDYEKEADLLKQYENLLDSDDLNNKQAELAKINVKLEEIWLEGEYTKLLERRGAKGLNAGTSADYTMYTVSLPVSELEFWFYMESERLVSPVFRQFYKELEVVKEERRMRTEDNPSGKLYESLLASSYWSHPYQSPTIGWSKDLSRLRKSDAEFLHKTYYRSDNMVAVIVGDVDLDEVRRLSEKYFGRLVKPEQKLAKKEVSPATQEGERIVKVKYKAESEFLIAYHKPTYPNPDSAYLSLLYVLLDEGRSSPFQKILVQEKQLVSSIYTTERPGDRYDPVFLIGGSKQELQLIKLLWR